MLSHLSDCVLQQTVPAGGLDGSPAHLSSSSTTGVVHRLHYHHHYWPAASRNHRGQIPGKRVDGNGSSSEDFGSNPVGSENLPGESGEI